MSITFDDLKAYLMDDLGIGTNQLDEETPLYSSGLIDSISLIQLVTFLEKKIGSKIRPTDLTLDNFDSAARILKFVQSQ